MCVLSRPHGSVGDQHSTTHTDGNWIVAQTLGMEKLVDLTIHSLGCFIAHMQKEIHAQVGWVWLVILA